MQLRSRHITGHSREVNDHDLNTHPVNNNDMSIPPQPTTIPFDREIDLSFLVELLEKSFMEHNKTLKLMNQRLSRIETTFECVMDNLQVPQENRKNRFIAGDLHPSGFKHQFSFGEIVTHCGRNGTIVDETLTHVKFKTNVSSQLCALTIEKRNLGMAGNFVLFEKV